MSDNFDDKPGSADDGTPSEDDFSEDAKTQLVDLDALQAGAESEESEPQFAPPPTMDSSDSAPPSDGGGEFDGEKTELFEVPPSMQDDEDDAITSSAPAYDADSFESSSGDAAPPTTSASFDSDPVSNNMSSVDNPDASVGGTSSGSSSGSNQVYVDSDQAGHDGATQFINVNDFADKKEAHFTPEQQQAGYDGSTQFVDVNALKAGSQAAGGDPIENDTDLQRGYEFGSNDIQRGEITLIHARNAVGRGVILKQVWEGRPEEMSTPLRERIAQLHEIKHPGLIAMNGMFVSDSGMWIELDAPVGQRLTEVIEQQGPMPPETVLDWVESIADVIEFIHGEQLAYANLTTDSVWIQNDGTIQLEPFDMLRLEDRGNLGVFGPPEMNAPDDQRQLSPATDVYSLAAVAAAALTGLPLRPANLEEYDDQKLVQKLYRALDDEAGERPQQVRHFVEELRGGDGLDIKIVGAGVAAVLLLSVAGLAVLTGDDPETTDEPVRAEVEDEPTGQGDVPAGDPPGADDPAEQPDDTRAESDGDQAVDLPGTVTNDPRLTIVTSYESNPPADADSPITAEQIEEWRTEIQEFRQEGDDARDDSDAFDAYEQALERLTQILRDDPSEDDRETWRELYVDDVVQQEVEELLRRIEESLLDGRIASANRRYGRLSRINPNANARSFMSEHNSADVTQLQRVGADDDEDDDE